MASSSHSAPSTSRGTLGPWGLTRPWRFHLCARVPVGGGLQLFGPARLRDEVTAGGATEGPLDGTARRRGPRSRGRPSAAVGVTPRFLAWRFRRFWRPTFPHPLPSRLLGRPRCRRCRGSPGRPQLRGGRDPRGARARRGPRLGRLCQRQARLVALRAPGRRQARPGPRPPSPCLLCHPGSLWVRGLPAPQWDHDIQGALEHRGDQWSLGAPGVPGGQLAQAGQWLPAPEASSGEQLTGRFVR